MTSPSKSGSVPIEQLRKQLFKTLLQRTDDTEVKRRLDAVILELRLMEGVGERPVGSARAKDPVVDLFLRLLGIGDDANKPAKLDQPLSPAQERATWVATKVFEAPEAPSEDEPLPDWAISEVLREKERTIIGLNPDASNLDDLDPEAAIADLEARWQEFEDDPPTNVERTVTELEAPQPTDGTMVSFGQNEDLTGAVAAEFYDVNERYRLDAEEREEPAASEDDGDGEDDDWGDGDDWEDDPEGVAATVAAAEALRTATPAPVRRTAAPPAPADAEPPVPDEEEDDDDTEKRHRALFAEADRRSPTPAATSPRDIVASRPPAVVSERAELEPEERGAEDIENDRLAQQRNIGLLVAAAGVGLMLVTGGVGYAAYQGSVSVNSAATAADSSKSSLYNAIAADPAIVTSIGNLGGDEPTLRARYLAYDGSNDAERTRRALAFAGELGRQWRDIKPGGSRYLRAEQTVKKILRAQDDYERAVVRWADMTQSPLGALSTGVGLARSPDANALVPLDQ